MPRTRLLPQDEAFRQRIEMTISCHDCDHIPKILEGGKIFEENGQRIQYMFNGLKVIAGGYYGGWMEEIIQRLRGHHEPQEEKVFSELLKLVRPDATMIELGAFWGYYSAWFGKTIPNSINYLIEPDPNRIVIGKTNFALNGLTGTFIEAMIGKESKTSSSFTCESDGSVRNIPTLSVDDLIAANKIKYVEVLHSDIQGAELDMLEGCLKSIHERKIRFILISTHQTPDPLTHFKCIDFLRKHDAHIFAAHSISAVSYTHLTLPTILRV